MGKQYIESLIPWYKEARLENQLQAERDGKILSGGVAREKNRV